MVERRLNCTSSLRLITLVEFQPYFVKFNHSYNLYAWMMFNHQQVGCQVDVRPQSAAQIQPFAVVKINH
ncbi:hypothetical protein BYT27DRAFT_7198096, partial [Phlegmacium glaucopus]